MTLRDRKGERQLRARCRERIRRSDAMRREYDKAPKARWTIRTAINYLLIGVLVALHPSFWASVGENGVALAITAAMCILTRTIRNQAHAHEDGCVLCHLPVTEHHLFYLAARHVIGLACWMLVLLLALGHCRELLRVGEVFSWSRVAVLTVAQWEVMMGVAIGLACLQWDGPYLRIALAFIALTVSMAFKSWATHVAPLAQWLPAGVTDLWVQDLVSEGRWLWVWMGLMVGLFVLVGLFALWQRMYLKHADDAAEALQEADRIEQSDDVNGASTSGTTTRSAHDIDWTILTPWDAKPTRWIERLLARGLTERERCLIGFMTGGTPTWTGSWWIGTGGVAITCGAMWLFPKAVGVTVFLGVVTMLWLWPVMGGVWSGLERASFGLLQVPLYAFWPMGYWELSRAMFKVALVRVAAGWPVVVAGGMCLGYGIMGVPLSRVVALAARAAIIVLSLQPFAIGLRFACGMKLRTWRNAPYLLGTVVVVLCMMGLAMASLAAPRPWSLSAYGVLIVLSVVYWLWTGWLHEQGQVDLIFQERE